MDHHRLGSGPLQCPDDIGLPPTMTNPVLFRACGSWALWPVVLCLAVLSGCSFTPTLGRDSFKPYVPEVVQGNVV